MEDNNDKLSVATKLARIDAKMDMIINSHNRLMYAMLGIIGATIGVKFIGSPPWVIVAAYLAFFSSAYLLASTAMQWNVLTLKRRLLRLVFVVFVSFSVICKNFIFKTGVVPAPIWYGPVIDIFLIIITILLVLVAWEYDGRKK